MDRANGRCEWPACHDYGTDVAHLTAIGAGGTHGAAAEYINSPDNVAFLCRFHHMIQEGETVRGRKREVTELLRSYLRGRV